MKHLIVCADDFGLDAAVNSAVEEAHQNGILSTASLMVGAPAAGAAVALARRLPGLHVGLHLVLVDGRPVSPPDAVPALVGADGRFRMNMVCAGFRFFFLPEVRRQLRREIRAQFEAFRSTGLALDHVNAHKHMHLHPTVGDLIVDIGREYGMQAVRVPAEPATALRRAFPAQRAPTRLLAVWVERLRRRLQHAGVTANDHLFGLAWTGKMVEERVLCLLPHLPDGVSEMYFHPATERTSALAAAMPDYRHVEELAALTSAAIKARIRELDIRQSNYSALAN